MEKGIKEISERQREYQRELDELSSKYGFDVSEFVLKGHKNLGSRNAWSVHKFNKKLYRCPFCGGKAEIINLPSGVEALYGVGCTKCGMRSKGYEKILDAFAKWNTRTWVEQ